MTGTSLLRSTALTATGARAMTFPAAILGGYSARAVEVFRDSVTDTLGQMERALADYKRANGELAARNQYLEEQLAAVPPSEDHQAVSVLRMAQENGEHALAVAREEAIRITGQARHEQEQMLEHARQQAGEIVSQAVGDAKRERDKIIENGTADVRRLASQWRKLAKEMQDQMRSVTATLAGQVNEWDERARQDMSASVG